MKNMPISGGEGKKKKKAVSFIMSLQGFAGNLWLL